ncbi:putative rhamnosyl transferase [uncultured Tateyamaria sp.]|uniref:putative rhamnosyl transferase n=1 Tax=uncultured Tateyamaria sp. TaxID=455651 RepID=UPI002625F18D|nr:putative rhamnosyl transferase [uncultured Tateyamaria sp.]
MQVIGLCRFSYPAIGGFQVDFDDFQKKLDYLYAPERMEERFATFETLMLPPLKAQTDPLFTLVVVVGESLPGHYRDRLEAALDDVPQAIVQEHPPAQHRPIMKQVINSVRFDDGLPCLQFRMDDDDAVSVDFVERLRSVAQDIAPLAKREKLVAIDFNRGFIVKAGAHGVDAIETTAPFQTAGLALMVQPGMRQTIMNFAHHKLGERMTCVTLTDTPPMLLRGHNAFNDSRQGPSARPHKLAPMDKAGETMLQERFNISADTIRGAFSAL